MRTLRSLFLLGCVARRVGGQTIYGILAVLYLMGAVASVRAQDARGLLSGRVLDPSGAAVAGAMVELLQPDRGVRTEANTNSQGHFELPYLSPSTYTLRASAPGFKTYERKVLKSAPVTGCRWTSNSRSGRRPRPFRCRPPWACCKRNRRRLAKLSTGSGSSSCRYRADPQCRSRGWCREW